MKNKYYKTIKPAAAKARLTKLIEAEKEAWEDFRAIKRAGLSQGSCTYDCSLSRAMGFSSALQVMKIVESDYLED